MRLVVDNPHPEHDSGRPGDGYPAAMCAVALVAVTGSLLLLLFRLVGVPLAWWQVAGPLALALGLFTAAAACELWCALVATTEEHR